MRPLATAILTVAVAWDGSRQAARAVADALPFLRRAKTVRAFTATDDKPLSSAQAQQFVEYLAGFGIEAIHEDVKKTDQHSIGSFLEAYVVFPWHRPSGHGRLRPLQTARIHSGRSHAIDSRESAVLGPAIPLMAGQCSAREDRQKLKTGPKGPVFVHK